jgi:secondary thiamine-phosphate synthase enzyme
MRQANETLRVGTQRRGLVEITSSVVRFVRQAGVQTGLVVVWCRHTSASLLVQENADPEVRADLEAFFARIAPEGRGLYVHDAEGPDDMPAHIRAALTQTQLTVPVAAGELALGTWQGIYLFEHRTRPHQREVVLHVMGS